MKLDIGCGKSKRPGFTGVDILPLDGVDIVHNLNSFPYPFQDDSIDEIWMDQVLEHVEQPMMVVQELFRICKPGAKLTIGVPYFRGRYAFIDPTHRNFFSVDWFQYFDPRHIFHQRYAYTSATFQVDKIEFDREFTNAGFIRSQFVKLANKKAVWYEEKISHLVPMNSLTFYLTTVK